MTAPSHEHLERLFHEALELSPEARLDLLARLRASDAGLATELEALLAVQPESADLIARLGQAVPELGAGDALPGEPLDGARIGPYRVLGTVGEGGMGVVYRAERTDGEFDQRVAVKLVKRGMDSDEVLRRFRAERQILANLEHPNIARLYDGGVAEDGRPYLAMEFIEGERITTFADAHRLSVPDRLALFRSACEAVRFAHRNLVVHRDLKPSNILVTADGTVKLLDFGIAKLLDPSSEELTRVGARVMTPAYAAPEQVEGGAVTTAADVYSLGVVLHELLTGRRPDSGRDDSLPSKSVGTSYEQATERATTEIRSPEERSADRGTTPEGLKAALKGDLDAIMLKALSRDVSARYSSVDEVIDDLDRHRRARPVSARLHTPAYRAGRFLRRNWAPVAAAAAVATSLAVGLGVAVGQRNVARSERDAAEAVTRYLEGMFESVNPVGSDPGADTLRVVDFLERSTEKALTELQDQPALQARMLRTLGAAHFSLWEYERAEDLWARASDAYTRAGLDPEPGLSRDRGAVAVELSDWAAVDSLLPRSLALAEATGDDAGVAGVLRLQARSYLYRDRFAEAEEALDGAIPILRTLEDEEALADALYLLAGSRIERGDPDGAVEPQREGLAIFRRLRGDDAQTAIGLTNLAVLMRMSGRLDAADTTFAEALSIHEARTPPGSAPYVAALTEYANLLSNLGRAERADSMFRVATVQASEAGDRRRLVGILANHSSHRRSVGDGAGSVELARRALAAADEIYGSGTPATAPMLTMLALSLDAVGDSTGAERRYADVLGALGDGADRSSGPRVIAERGVARALSRQGRHQAAEVALLELLERTPPGASPESAAFRTRQATLRELANAYERWGRSDDAERYRRMIDEQARSSESPSGRLPA